MNLVKKRVSKVGFDAFVLLFFNRKKSKIIRKEPRFIKRMGIISLLVALGAINELLSIFVEKIWPYIKN